MLIYSNEGPTLSTFKVCLLSVSITTFYGRIPKAKHINNKNIQISKLKYLYMKPHTLPEPHFKAIIATFI